ncbi:inositol monophosphatase [Neisseriaceae bacterium PsAf]|nr:inositol monophosphatase [Neisseriaceae bacterium PsAf]MCV2503325.1 inositol monophosphatase [Neisseriaceae bacterium]
MDAYINTAVKIARRVANMMLRAANDLSSIRVENKAFNDFVSEVDQIAEEMIVEGLLEAFPTHRIKTEETGYHGNNEAEFEWIIDPLDGTTNYLHHHPQYAISMALLHKGSLLDAVIFAPERNDLYIASKGKGAFLNDKRIRVSKRTQMNECLIGTGFPVVDQSMMTTYMAILQDVLAKTAGARREGAASLDLCNVALGRFDGYFEFNLKPWDVAAGALIVMEAGGLVADMQGEGTWLETGNIVAGNPKILSQLLQIIDAHIK